MFLPPGGTLSTVKFYRNYILCVSMGSTSSGCVIQNALPRYNYNCVSDLVYSLTIPAESMTEFEYDSFWKCEYYHEPLYKSPNIHIKFAGKSHQYFRLLDINILFSQILELSDQNCIGHGVVVVNSSTMEMSCKT